MGDNGSPNAKNDQILIDLSHMVSDCGSNSGTPSNMTAYRKIGQKKSSFNKQISACKPSDNTRFNFEAEHNH